MKTNKIGQQFTFHQVYPNFFIKAMILYGLCQRQFKNQGKTEIEADIENYCEDAWNGKRVSFALDALICLNNSN